MLSRRRHVQRGHPLFGHPEAAQTGVMRDERVTDRQVYETLARAAEELIALSERAESFVGETALRTAATSLAGTAKAVYDHCMDGDGAH